MADNTTLNTGSGGDVIATDDISGVKYQRVKVNYGTDGFATDVDYATPLPVDATARSSATGTITTSTSTITLTGAHGGAATVFISGTYSGVTFTVELSNDGTTWFQGVTLPVSATSGSLSTSVTPATNASAAYSVALWGATQIRVRATAYTSGTANVVIVTNGLAIPPPRQVVDNSGTTVVQNFTHSNYAQTAGISRDNIVSGNASATGSSVTTPMFGRNVVWAMIVSAITGTSPTITFRLQASWDGGTTFVDVDTTNLQTTSVTAAGTSYLRWGPDYTTAANAALKDTLPSQMRLAWTITGTSPAVTFKSYSNFGS